MTVLHTAQVSKRLVSAISPRSGTHTPRFTALLRWRAVWLTENASPGMTDEIPKVENGITSDLKTEQVHLNPATVARL